VALAAKSLGRVGLGQGGVFWLGGTPFLRGLWEWGSLKVVRATWQPVGRSCGVSQARRLPTNFQGLDAAIFG
jgi:hypothetical protein